jgi:3-hydroxyacyl-CoA dehydrogenase
MGKTPVQVLKDSPGFIVNRILITYLNEAAKLLSKKYNKEQIDATMQYKAKMPLGPFMLMDLIGIDVTYDILKVFERKLGSDYKPTEAIKELYRNKRFGRKTMNGFYNYNEKPKIKAEEAQYFNHNILLNRIINEAEKVVKEGIATEKTVDIALKHGANFPKGPFEMKGDD